MTVIALINEWSRLAGRDPTDSEREVFKALPDPEAALAWLQARPPIPPVESPDAAAVERVVHRVLDNLFDRDDDLVSRAIRSW